MNYKDLVFDIGRVVISFGVVATWLYCEVNTLACANSLRIVSISILASWLGLEGLDTFISGLSSGKYKKGGGE